MPKAKHPHDSHEPELTPHQELEILAYRFWEHRGRPEGDADTDWYHAEHELERQREAAKRL